jgi:hypothetical protein
VWVTGLGAGSPTQAATPRLPGTLDVCPSGCPYAHIQDAINAAASGDTINIAAGTYAEHLDIEKSLTLLGAGASTTAIDGSNSGTTIGISNTAALVTLSGVTIQHGNAAGNGGGIANSGTLTLTNSTIVSNTAANSGGGVFNIGTLALTNNTLSGNSAGSGGGIAIGSPGTATLVNSTVNGNTARWYGGGGIYNDGTLTVTNSTLSGNTTANAANSGGGIDNLYGATLTLANTVVAGNTATIGPDCIGGSLTSGGYNLLGISDGCSGLTNGVNGDQVGTFGTPLDPRLGPLQDNGGPTWTMAPQPGSPALDAVPAASCTLTADQRGQPRPDPLDSSGACDIGAVEVQDIPLSATSTNTPTPTGTSAATAVPTNTSTATPTMVPSSAPSATTTSVPTATPTRPASIAPTATATVLATPSPSASATPRPTSRSGRITLTLRAASHLYRNDVITMRLHAARNSTLTLTVEITVTSVRNVVSGTGRHRKRHAVHVTTVLYRRVVHARTNGRGDVTVTVPLRYSPRHSTRATLVVREALGQRSASAVLAITVEPGAHPKPKGHKHH